MANVRFVQMTLDLFPFLPLPPIFLGQNIAQSPEIQGVLCSRPHVTLAMIEGGKLIGVGGVAMVDGSPATGMLSPLYAGTGRAYAWMQPGAWMTRKHFGYALARCRLELERLGQAGARRVECTVRCGHRDRARWVERLGFRWEAKMHGYGPDRSDCNLYARILSATGGPL
jgi:hypothetical protein